MFTNCRERFTAGYRFSEGEPPVRLSSARIRNFHCLRDVTVEFDDITSIIGPNDAGKSSVLRALDWCLNGTNSLSEKDVSFYAEPEEQWIEVAVTFTDFEPGEREAIGDLFLPAGAESLTISRSWQNGQESATCEVMAYPPFASVRDRSLTAPKALEAYKALQNDGSLLLPTVSSKGKAETAMREWEQAHLDQLVAQPIDAASLIGSKGVIAKYFEYVFVSVDMRAGEQGRESKGSILSRLAGSLDKKEFEDRIQALDMQVERRKAAIIEEFQTKTEALSGGLSAEVNRLCAGRSVHIDPVSKRPRPSIELELRVSHGKTRAGLEYQGHGVQRATMLAAMLHLADRDRMEEERKSILLAIEEPEIYQNPIQARNLAGALRERATVEGSRLSVVYATHSPVFADPLQPEQVRRLGRPRNVDDGLRDTTVRRYSRSALEHQISEKHVPRSRLSPQILSVLSESFTEAFFAEAVVLVEGETDKAVIEEVAAKEDPLERYGVTVVNAGGKANLIIAHAILKQLGIPSLTVFDSDRGNPDRLRARNKPVEAQDEQRKGAQLNRALMEHHDIRDRSDYPKGYLGPTLFAWDDNLEEVLMTTWPEWETTWDQVRRELDEGKTKRPAIYRLTARRCPGQVSRDLDKVITIARGLTSL